MSGQRLECDVCSWKCNGEKGMTLEEAHTDCPGVDLRALCKDFVAAYGRTIAGLAYVSCGDGTRLVIFRENEPPKQNSRPIQHPALIVCATCENTKMLHEEDLAADTHRTCGNFKAPDPEQSP